MVKKESFPIIITPSMLASLFSNGGFSSFLYLVKTWLSKNFFSCAAETGFDRGAERAFFKPTILLFWELAWLNNKENSGTDQLQI